MKDKVKKFLKIFDGYELAYGQHRDLIESSSGKVEGKGDTIPLPIEDNIVENHLSGDGSSLGIIPLKLQDTVRFAAIDLDHKNPQNPLIHTIEELQKKINDFQLPLIACQSKSKGVHLYCFAKEDVSAKLMIEKVSEWASLLGYGSSEIFPKQTSRAGKGDKGSWINVPYFNYKETVRYAIDHEFKPLSIDDFFKYVEVCSIGKEHLQDFKIEDQYDQDYKDSPPCLQALATLGIDDGSRNNGLYNFAIYCKKKYGDNFEEKLMEINGTLIRPSLKASEVESIVRSVKKSGKEYFYKCNEYPIVQYCNKTECKNRKFGICQGMGSSAFDLQNLTKYLSYDGTATWYLESQGVRFKLTTDELVSQALFKKKLLDAIGQLWITQKAKDWDNTLTGLLSKCEVYSNPMDASPQGQFNSYLDSFLLDSPPGDQKDDILKRHCFYDKKENLMYFTSTKLFEYLKNRVFRHPEDSVWSWLREMGGKSKQIKIKGKSVRLWYVAAPDSFLDDDTI